MTGTIIIIFFQNVTEGRTYNECSLKKSLTIKTTIEKEEKKIYTVVTKVALKCLVSHIHFLTGSSLLPFLSCQILPLIE